MSTAVVALGAWCDLDLLDEEGPTPGSSGRGRRFGWSPVPQEEAHPDPGSASFRVHEFANLADGRRVTLRAGLGFSLGSRRHDHAAGTTQELDPWHDLTREDVESAIRNVVLPDDDSGDEHPYEWLRELLARQGIETSAAQLRTVRYAVELSDRLERRLRDGRPSDDGQVDDR